MNQPEAASAPNHEALAASSSTWKGWGSKRRANASISSRSTTAVPSSKIRPAVKSSKASALT